MTRRVLIVAFAASMAVLSTARTAHADAAAESLYDEGNQLYDAGDFARACPKYEASLKIDPMSIDTRGRLALCYEKAGRLASAWSAWREIKGRASRMQGRERAVEIAVQHIAELEPKLARLTLRLGEGAGPAPAQLVVTLDGTAIPAESFGSAVAVDKGTHKIEAQAPGHKPWSKEVTIDDGEKKDVALGPFEVDATATPPGPDLVGRGGPVHKPSSTRKWIGIGTTGVGVVALGIGAVMGLDAMGKRDDADAAGCDADLTNCMDATSLGLANEAYDAANLSTGFVIAGGVLTVTGLVIWMTAPTESRATPGATAWRVTPHVGPGQTGVALSGTF